MRSIAHAGTGYAIAEMKVAYVIADFDHGARRAVAERSQRSEFRAYSLNRVPDSVALCSLNHLADEVRLLDCASQETFLAGLDGRAFGAGANQRSFCAHQHESESGDRHWDIGRLHLTRLLILKDLFHV